MQKFRAVLAPSVAFVIATLAGSSGWRGQDKPPAAEPPKPQPVPFSHKGHTQFLRECKDCHEISFDGWTMSYPPEAKCMTCHATVKADSPSIKKLAQYASEKRSVPWVHIYAVPDYVYFSHRTHVQKAELDCEACHGAVRERDALTKEKSTSMAACISCHKEKGAPIGCRTCHDTI